MKVCFADLIKVIRAQAFLGRHRARVFIDVPQELPLELLHPRGRKKHGRVVLRDQ